MKDKLLGIAGGLLALMIVFMLLSPPPESEEISYPSTEDKKQAGLYVAFKLLKQHGMDVVSLRQRFSDLLVHTDLPESGNLLVINLPSRHEFQLTETDDLMSWVRQGNSLLVLCDLTPSGSYNDCEHSSILRDLSLDVEMQEPEVEDVSQSVSMVIKEKMKFDQMYVPINDLAYMKNVLHLQVEKNRLIPESVMTINASGVVIPMLIQKDLSRAVFWQVRAGKGRVWLSGISQVFSNHQIDKADNARLLMNIAGFSLAEDGKVIFDDFHQGLSDIYDPNAFWADQRLHHSFYFILLFWFILLIGRRVRLAPLSTKKPLPSAARFVSGVAGLFSRAMADRSIFEGLLKHMNNDVRSQYGLPQNGEPVWELLQDASRVDQKSLQQLKYYADNPNQKMSLVKARNLIRLIRNSLL